MYLSTFRHADMVMMSKYLVYCRTEKQESLKQLLNHFLNVATVLKWPQSPNLLDHTCLMSSYQYRPKSQHCFHQFVESMPQRIKAALKVKKCFNLVGLVVLCVHINKPELKWN